MGTRVYETIALAPNMENIMFLIIVGDFSPLLTMNESLNKY